MGMSFLPFWGFVIAYGVQQVGNAMLSPTNRGQVMALAEPKVRGRVAAFRGLMIDVGTLAGNFGALAMISMGAPTGWVFGVGGVVMGLVAVYQFLGVAECPFR